MRLVRPAPPTARPILGELHPMWKHYGISPESVADERFAVHSDVMSSNGAGGRVSVGGARPLRSSTDGRPARRDEM